MIYQQGNSIPKLSESSLQHSPQDIDKGTGISFTHAIFMYTYGLTMCGSSVRATLPICDMTQAHCFFPHKTIKTTKMQKYIQRNHSKKCTTHYLSINSILTELANVFSFLREISKVDSLIERIIMSDP